MTSQRPAYEEVTIAHGGSTVTLRPSLRAATTLVDRYGFPALFLAVEDFNLTIVSEIILTTATNRRDSAAFLAFQAGKPLLPLFYASRQPLVELVFMLQPAPDKTAIRSSGAGKPVAWMDFFADLFGKATGWLGWTPESAWNATPTEIDRSYSALVSKLKAIHGNGEGEPASNNPQEEISDGEALDGLAKLKANARRGKR